jgi:uncharacterized protein
VGPLVVPAMVVAEVAYMVASRLGTEPEVRFLGAIAAGELIVEPVHATDWIRVAELVWAYRDIGLGTTDASVIAAAERLGQDTIATLDRRDFSVVRPAHVAAFQLLPD